MRTSVPSTHVLPGDFRLRVRLPQANDRSELASLAERTGTVLDVEALLHFDPRRRTVLVAGAWVGASRIVVGVVVVDRLLADDPEVLVGDEALAPGVTALLAEVAARDGAARERFAA